MNRILLLLLSSLALTLAPPMTQAHEVPDRVNVSVFVKAEQDRLVILVRLPANALIDFQLPTLSVGNWVDLAHAGSLTEQGANVWIADMLSLREGDKILLRPQLLAARLSRVGDPSFRNFDDALSRIKGAPLPTATLALQDQLTVDAMLQTPIKSPASQFFFEPRFARLGVIVETSLTYLPSDGSVHQFNYQSDPEAFALEAGKVATLTRFVKEGFAHYFNETDYLLLAICIALLCRDFRELRSFVAIITAGQGLTLIIALDATTTAVWLRGICGAAIAAAVVYLGSEAIIAGGGRRRVLAAVLGVIFGYACWIGLQPLVQFGGAHDITAGIAFLTGVLIAELLVLTACAATLHLISKFSRAPRGTAIVIAGIAIHIAWRRLLDRADALALVPLEYRNVDSTTLMLGSFAILAAIIACAYYQKNLIKPL